MVYILGMRNFIKQTLPLFIFVIITVNFSINNALCYAQTSAGETVSAIETGLFGYDYKNESTEKRIERIETHLYGTKKTGDLSKRLKEIQDDTGIVASAPVKNDVNATSSSEKIDNSMQQNTRSAQNSVKDLKESAEVEYPMVDKMEDVIFGKSFKTENIYVRLDRLEEKVFGKKNNDDLYERVDKLASTVIPANKKQDISERYAARDLDSYYNSSGLEKVNTNTLPFQLAAMEKDLLKKDYQSDSTAARLGRLEHKLFNRTFSTDSDTTRMQRIIVAYDAKKNSFKYENNRRAQNAATISQIGGILLMILAILL